MNVQIAPSWKLALNPLFEKPYFAQIAAHLKTEKALHKTIYPKGSQIFNAFEQTLYDDVKVVKLEQNYRSTKTILNVANEIIGNNKGQLEKKLFTENADGEKPARVLSQ